jgi:hypothetical protein
MTTPKDPNQPGWAAPPEANQPAQPGWGQTPPQPGWAAPPEANQPAQPGWGQTPAQPGWGAPPAQPGWGQTPAQPGWGQTPAQPGWGQPGWNAAPPAKKGHGCLIAFLIVLGLLVVGVGGCVWLVYPYVSTDLKLLNDLGTNRVSSVEFEMNNGQNTWIIHVNPGYEDEAVYMACHIIRPDLQGTQFANDSFEVVDRYGRILASDQTPCT